MVFGGFQKLTLLDYPGKVSCTLFTKGCNFYCPFCHNAFLVDVDDRIEQIEESEVLSYLKKRQGILEGVCISGGEPLLNREIDSFMEKVKALGYSIKLDTNGSFPERLKELVAKGLVDYVAMDVKNSLDKYAATAGCENINLNNIEESIDFLLSGTVDYEFRTTVVNELHTAEDIEKLAKRIKGAKRYFLQNFVDSGNVIEENLNPLNTNELEAMKEAAQKYVEAATVRGEK